MPGGRGGQHVTARIEGELRRRLLRVRVRVRVRARARARARARVRVRLPQLSPEPHTTLCLTLPIPLKVGGGGLGSEGLKDLLGSILFIYGSELVVDWIKHAFVVKFNHISPTVCSRLTNPYPCLLYTSPSPRDRQKSRMPSSA